MTPAQKALGCNDLDGRGVDTGPGFLPEHPLCLGAGPGCCFVRAEERCRNVLARWHWIYQLPLSWGWQILLESERQPVIPRACCRWLKLRNLAVMQTVTGFELFWLQVKQRVIGRANVYLLRFSLSPLSFSSFFFILPLGKMNGPAGNFRRVR